MVPGTTRYQAGTYHMHVLCYVTIQAYSANHTCKNATYKWRYYDWLNPQCGATFDAEGPYGVLISVEILSKRFTVYEMGDVMIL